VTGGIDTVAGRRSAAYDADVCVIGSGCGGATAARVLAEAGREVIVLEEGSDRTGLQLTQRDGEMYDQLYQERGGRATDDLSISVLSARVLGGGGVINASDVVPIPPGVLRHWRTRFGLSELTDAALAPYAAAALQDLSASRIDDAQLNQANRLLRAGAEALGWAGHTMMHNRVGCAGMGTCLIGCPLDAKRNPRMVAIPAAVAAGARFVTRARALRVEGASREHKRVVGHTLDERGHRETGELVVRARTIVVACNAVASAELLLRSGIGSPEVGRNLVLQPQLPIVAQFDHPVRAFRGIPQAYAVTEFEEDDHPEHGLWGFRIEPVMGTPGIVATLLPYLGDDNARAMAAYDRIAAALLLAPDAPSGTVELGGHDRPIVRYAHTEEHKRRLRAAARAAARLYLAAGAREVMVPSIPPIVVRSAADLDRIDALAFRPATVPLLSAHQQGTVRLGTSPDRGGADPDGQVYGTRGVYVMDASIFPSTASSHTMAPVLTMARYLASKLVA
jgi:choline dehydrogenase-like flavoprotein